MVQALALMEYTAKVQMAMAYMGKAPTRLAYWARVPIVLECGVTGKTYDFYAWKEDGSIAYGQSSSRLWKINILNIPHPLEKISKLRGVYFDWNADHGGLHDVGFIAEETGAEVPEIVGYEENGIDATGMDYCKITPLLVEAANAMRREYQEKSDEQKLLIKTLIAALEMIHSEINKLKQMLMMQISKTIPSD
jgi:hypothetical protein